MDKFKKECTYIFDINLLKQDLKRTGDIGGNAKRWAEPLDGKVVEINKYDLTDGNITIKNGGRYSIEPKWCRCIGGD
nr:MAG TPA: hypothetical protein [Caudoviricetes sp.]